MMKIGTITLLQSFVILLSISTTVARDKDSNLRQDTGPLIEQHLFDGNTEIQVDKSPPMDSLRHLQIIFFHGGLNMLSNLTASTLSNLTKNTVSLKHSPVTMMGVSFYRLGATPQLLSNDICKFQQDVSF
jgi:hypothetical protein